MDKSKWEYKKLEVDNLPIGDVFDIFMGRTPSRDDLSLWEDGSHEWVSIGDMGTTKYISDTKEKVSDKACTNMRLVPKDTVIMSFKLSIGKVAITEIPLYTNEAIMAFPPKSGYNISPNYLYYNLQAYKWQSANRAVMGKTLNKAVISSSRITIPDSETQQRIVAELDCLNEMIALKQEQLNEFDKLAQSIFYDMFGDPITNEKGWKDGKMGEFCTITSSKRIFANEYCEEGVPFYRGKEITELSKGFPISVELNISQSRYEEIKRDYGIPSIGDILITAVGTIGNIWVVNDNSPFYFKDGNIVWVKDIKGFDAIYFKTILTILISAYKHEMAQGCAYNALTIVNLKKMKVLLPPLALQQQFAEKIQAIEAQKELVKKSIAETQQLLDSRMDYYFD